MSAKHYLYRRPDHAIVKMPQRQPGSNTVLVTDCAVSAFNGIEIALRGTKIGGGTLVESLRILRRIEEASHDVPKLEARYLVLKPSERKLIEEAVVQFDWSKFCADTGANLWTNWMEFLEGFDPESDRYAKTWIAFDPLNPPTEYADWKAKHTADLAAYNEAVAAAEAAKLSNAAPTAPPAQAEASSAPAAESVAVADPVPASEPAAE